MPLESSDLASTPEAAAQRRAVLFDTVNRMGDDNFVLWLDELEDGTSSSPPHAFVETSSAGSRTRPRGPWDLDKAPTRLWEHGGWTVKFMSPHRRGAAPSHQGQGATLRNVRQGR